MFSSTASTLTDAVADDDLAQRSLETILEELLRKHGPQTILLDVNDRYYEHRGNRFALKYPFSGDLHLLMAESSLVRQGGDSGGESYAEIPLEIAADSWEDFADHLGQILKRVDEQIIADVRTANERIERHQAAFAEALRQKLQPRWTMTRTLRGAMKQLQIPLSRPEGVRVNVPVSPAPLSMRVLELAAAAGEPHWALAAEMGESVVQTIASFSRALERLPRTTEQLLGQNEETLRDVLLFVLNANFQGQITGETFIGQGKSDLLLRWKDRDAFVGECKMWKGPKALCDGLDQLLTRYTLWRQTRIALVLFIRDPKDATAILASAHAAIRNHPRTQRLVDASEPSLRGDYEVVASGDESRLARLTFLPVVIG